MSFMLYWMGESSGQLAKNKDQAVSKTIKRLNEQVKRNLDRFPEDFVHLAEPLVFIQIYR